MELRLASLTFSCRPGRVVAAANDGLSIASSSVNDSLKSSAFSAPTEAP